MDEVSSGVKYEMEILHGLMLYPDDFTCQGESGATQPLVTHLNPQPLVTHSNPQPLVAHLNQYHTLKVKPT
jgi:hypothetical protein